MPANPNTSILLALRRFMKAASPNNNEPTTLNDAEISAGRELVLAIEGTIDERVKQALNAQLPLRIKNAIAEQSVRVPQR
jgi:hypothetical protein